jgi:hypothetical protein
MKQLRVYTSLDPKNSVGWMRDDIPGGYVVHVFAQALPGAMFQPSDGRGGPHWPCEVCKMHGYTEADFHEQMLELMRETNR